MKGVNGSVVALVLLRFLFGALAGVAFINQDFTYGALFFAVGLFTKMVDVPMSVISGKPIPADSEVYRIVAVAFNGSAFFGLMYGFCEMACLGKLAWLYPILLLAITGGLMSLSLLGRWIPWVRPHSIFAKMRSGILSSIIIVFIVEGYPPALLLEGIAIPSTAVILSLLFITIGECYKIFYYSRQKKLPA